ncbi:MAG: hypothetical protein K8T20_04470 [Planctomycetes bacterium]|nr:hypothetical protein [Planctomycetota bacterium]
MIDDLKNKVHIVGVVGGAKAGSNKNMGGGGGGPAVPTAREDFKQVGGTDSDWNLMTSAGYEFDPSKMSAGGWMYKGDPACAQEYIAPSGSHPSGQYQVEGKVYEDARKAIVATAACLAAKGKGGSIKKNGKNGKCCCCCSCKKQNGMTQPLQGSSAVVFSGSSSSFWSGPAEGGAGWGTGSGFGLLQH